MCEVKFTPRAHADLKALDPPTAQRVLNKIRWLAENCDAVSHEPLTGPLRGYYKLRTGNYRVLYRFERSRQRIIVHFVGHRGQVYERLT